MRTGLFTGHFANGRYAISVIATYYIEIKKRFCSAWNHRMAIWKVPRKKSIPNFRPNSIGGFAMSETKKPPSQNSHKKYRWFCGERTQRTTEPTFSIKSIGGFAVGDTEKPPQRKKKVSVVLPLTKLINDSKNSIGGLSVPSTDNSHRWFYRLLQVH